MSSVYLGIRNKVNNFLERHPEVGAKVETPDEEILRSRIEAIAAKIRLQELSLSTKDVECICFLQKMTAATPLDKILDRLPHLLAPDFSRLLTNVLSFLEIKDLGRLSQVSRHLNVVVANTTPKKVDNQALYKFLKVRYNRATGFENLITTEVVFIMRAFESNECDHLNLSFVENSEHIKSLLERLLPLIHSKIKSLTLGRYDFELPEAWGRLFTFVTELSIGESILSHANWLKYFPQLEVLKIQSAPYLTGFREIRHCKNLLRLTLWNCLSLESIYFVRECKNLNAICLQNCPDLKGIGATARYSQTSALDECKKLECFRLVDCLEARISNFFSGKISCELKQLTIENALPGVVDLDWLGKFPELTAIFLHCDGIRNIGGIAQCTKLENVQLKNCWVVVDFSALSHLRSMSNLALYGVTSAVNQKSFEGVSNTIRELELYDCERLVDLGILKHFRYLAYLTIEGYLGDAYVGLRHTPFVTHLSLIDVGRINLQSVALLGFLKDLTIEVDDYTEVENVEELNNCENLEYLRISTELTEVFRDLDRVKSGECKIIELR